MTSATRLRRVARAATAPCRSPQSIFDRMRLSPAIDAGPGQRHVLPGPGVLRLVGGEGVDMGGERSRLAGRSQAEVDLVERPLGGRRRQRGQEPLRQPREILRRRRAAACRRKRRRARRNRKGRSGRGRTRPSSRGRRACPWRAPRPRPPRIRPCARSNSRRTCVEQRARRRPRQGRQRPCPRLRAPIVPASTRTPIRKACSCAEDAGAVEHVLIAVGLGERAREPLREDLPLRHPAEEGRVDQRIEHVRPVDDGLGEPRGGRRSWSRGDRAGRDWS